MFTYDINANYSLYIILIILVKIPIHMFMNVYKYNSIKK